MALPGGRVARARRGAGYWVGGSRGRVARVWARCPAAGVRGVRCGAPVSGGVRAGLCWRAGALRAPGSPSGALLRASYASLGTRSNPMRWASRRVVGLALRSDRGSGSTLKTASSVRGSSQQSRISICSRGA